MSDKLINYKLRYKELEIITARKISPDAARRLHNNLGRMLGLSQKETIMQSLVESDNDEFWMTLSEKKDGITYIDLYQAE